MCCDLGQQLSAPNTLILLSAPNTLILDDPETNELHESCMNGPALSCLFYRALYVTQKE